MIIVYSMEGIVAHYFKKIIFQPYFVSVHGLVIADHSSSIGHKNSMANIYDLFTITWKMPMISAVCHVVLLLCQ